MPGTIYSPQPGEVYFSWGFTTISPQTVICIVRRLAPKVWVITSKVASVNGHVLDPEDLQPFYHTAAAALIDYSRCLTH